METIKNFYTVSPNDLESGDVLVCKVVAHITKWQGKTYYALYRCASDEVEGSHEIPQGNRIYDEIEGIASQLFPVLIYGDGEPVR